MNESEQRLTDEFAKLATQYAEDRKRLQGQVNDLAGQVEQLAEQYERDQEHVAEQVSVLAENMQKLGEHVTTLTGAYEGLLEDVRRMINASNAVVRDLDELIR